MFNWLKKYFVSDSPSKVIESVLRRDLQWFDFEKMTNQEQIIYHGKIQHVLNNDAFQNEIKFYLTDLIEEIAKSDNEPNRDKKLRYSINGVETLMERLQAIPDPRLPVPSQDELDNDI